MEKQTRSEKAQGVLDLKPGDMVLIDAVISHPAWGGAPGNLFPYQSEVTGIRNGRRGVLLVRCANGFEYDMETGLQHNSGATSVRRA